jgi:sulfotransferase family protein
MNKNKITLIYILGAGRSGSTILSTIIGASKSVFNCADLMQIYEYGCLKKNCNDGYSIFESPFWSKVLKLYDPDNKVDYCKSAKENRTLEYHSSIINIFTSKKKVMQFVAEQEKLIQSISYVSKKNYIVDSSKYVNRAFLLTKLKNIDVRFIYNIRDSRGVINSFNKKVQSSRNPFSAILYYDVVNLMSELLYLTLPRSKKIKIRYEDIILDRTNTIDRLSTFLNINFDDVLEVLEKSEDVEIGPVIEGNRMVKKRKVKLYYDNEWLGKESRINRIIYYVFSLPFMVMNKYKI